ncbi:hypothetical protein MKZ08_19090 [Viridibacillus sp. FSL R5-0477]|uniref:S-layer protein n=1 Tax=Viridibacillus arenosi FSL R5-213 TaxID=1227360 RepID=W4F6D9_9BACL|nr:hypothetical protein [Viridibacillus arenosi]ETT87932.1 hypothetical protein C176_03278 [Viridibacillus arenosi FSL R5-213]OMC87560.1 hypothetical protein BK137_20615 [Viridibacillus arenosi]
MGKFRLKFVKPVASFAIGAAILTGSFAVTEDTNTAFAKSATVTITKGKLVSVNTGKAVKGYKSFKGVLYKDGKKFTGLYKKTYYKAGIKGTGLYKNVYYNAGKKGNGLFGKKLYQNGKEFTGIESASGKLYVKGTVANGVVLYQGTKKLYKNGFVVSTTVNAVKVINNTTIEVTFENAQKVSEITAGRFVIEGLIVTNAAIKATDDKVVVLTTSAQQAGRKYTVALDGVKQPEFVGVSAVMPTKVSLKNASLQGILGAQVTVEAQVDVENGQSKSYIPVTFTIGNAADTSKKTTVEVLTDENGVAKYSYIQHVFTQDSVYAYSSVNSGVKSSETKVYWGDSERLRITDVTKESTVANNSKKVYKVNVNPVDVSSDTKGKYVNVTFAENLNVTSDKINRKAQIVESNKTTPYQTATTQAGAKVYVNAKGEGTFTITGASTSVTPIVFANGNDSLERLDAAELQAKGSTVKFDIKHSMILNVEALGTENASNVSTVKNVVVGNTYAANFGGRQYVATITDLAGNKAPAKIPVKVALKGDAETAYIFQDNKLITPDRYGNYTLVTDKKGTVAFTVINRKVDSYIIPTVFIDNASNAGTGQLDDGDLQQTAPLTYFNEAIVSIASMKFVNANGEDVTSISAEMPVTLNYQTVDQNGLPYAPKVGSTVTFEFKSTFATVILSNGINKVITPGSADNSQLLTMGNNGSITFTLKSNLADVVNIEAISSDSLIVPATATLNVLDLATAFERANSVTDIDGMLAALYEMDSLNVKLSRLSVTNRTAVAKFVLEKRPAGAGYANQSDLEKEFNVKYNEVK